MFLVPPAVQPSHRVCIVKCECECCSTVYVCLLYTLVLCTLTTCVETVTCSVVYTLTCVLYVVLLFISIVCVTRIVRYSSTRDLLGLAVAPGFCGCRGCHSPEAVHL